LHVPQTKQAGLPFGNAIDALVPAKVVAAVTIGRVRRAEPAAVEASTPETALTAVPTFEKVA